MSYSKNYPHHRGFANRQAGAMKAPTASVTTLVKGFQSLYYCCSFDKYDCCTLTQIKTELSAKFVLSKRICLKSACRRTQWLVAVVLRALHALDITSQTWCTSSSRVRLAKRKRASSTVYLGDWETVGTVSLTNCHNLGDVM
jgi:hypothetical protein